MQPTLDEKAIVQHYFNTTGFDRWRRIYGTEQVSKVQADIRRGHQQTIDTVLAWLKADGSLKGKLVCDAGCGVGSLSIPLAALEARVYASDISEKMVAEARDRAAAQLNGHHELILNVSDLEALRGQYHIVICLDVLIHYPDSQMARMLTHLSSLAMERLIVSFAPKTPRYTLLKKIGEFFPGASKTTRAYLHSEELMVGILQNLGWQIERNAMIKTRFYFSRLLEAVRS
ncbi:magnesium protoporphyrin IX methyltransferase [Thermosynechococcus sp.]|uniref:magnesium protoporphyrin IX methyltransferase n=1 Tax=Thermosynechococcus sp. TaxID=2814275 RepID=UPI00391A2CFB